MADKVGSVYIEASVDTTGVIQAGKAISGATDKIEADLKSVGNAADTMSDKLNESGKSVSRFGIELSTADQKLGRFIDLQGRVREATGRFTTGMLANGESVKSFNQAIAGAGNETDKTGNKLGGFGGKVTALGAQLQDVAVQAQAGTSAFIILGQQGSQLASSFGPGGAVLGAVIAIASAIGGVLYTSLKNASGAMKELPEEMQKQLEEIKKRYSEIDEASQAAFTQAELGKLNTQYEKQLKVVTDLRSAVATYSAEASKGSQGAAVAAGLYAARLKLAEAELLNIGKLQARVGEELAGANVTGKLEDGLKDSTNAAEQLAAQLQTAVLKITDGELAARRYAAAQTLGLTAAEQLPPEIDAAIVKLTELEAAERRVTEQKRQQVEFQRESRAELDRELQAELQALSDKEKAQAKAASDREKLAGQVSSIGLTPEQQAEQQYQREVDLLRQANEQKILTEQEYQERLLTLRQQYEAKQGGGLFSTLSDSLKGLQNQVSGTFAQMALGFEDSDKLAQRLGQTIITELIGATINWGIQQAIAYAQGVAGEGAKAAAATASSATATAAATTGLGVVTAAAITSAGLIAAAMAPAAALTSLATAGANSAPATAGILATTGVAEGVALSTMALGGKLYGGPVQAGGMYPVTEDGRPEILKQGNRQYLLPGSRGGEVISNKEMQAAGVSGGGGTIVNINNYTGENVTQSRQQGPSGQEIISVVVGDINRRGQIHSAITRNTTAGNRSS
jgi:hypothetical protein